MSLASFPVGDESIYHQLRLDLRINDIRLICLYPGRWNEKIECTLYACSLDSAPSFKALSYVWGDARDCLQVVINGRFLQVTANLAAALRRLRHPSQETILWVDALCINQTDDAEKSHQVNMMRNIYMRANEGLLWLGDYEEGTLVQSPWASGNRGSEGTSPSRAYDGDPAASEEFYLPPKLEMDRAGPSKLPSRTTVVKAFRLIQFLASGDHIFKGTQENSALWEESLGDLRLILTLPWWNRVWTVQEAVLPRKATVVCGSMHLSWAVLNLAERNLLTHNNRQCCIAYMPEAIRNEYPSLVQNFNFRIGTISYYREHQDISPAALLAAFRYRQATDPRDKIFALLGLFSSNVAQFSRFADYSLTQNQVYQRTCLELIRLNNSLLSLTRAQEHGRNSSLPSWVPDWNATADETSSHHDLLLFRIHSFFNAGERDGLYIGASPETQLTLKGIMVDEIVRLIECPTSSVRRCTSYQNWWRDTIGFEGIHSTSYPYGGTYESMFWKVIMQGIWREEEIDVWRPPTDDDYADFLSSWENPNSMLGFFMRNRVLFLSKTGLLGSGPFETRTGDTIHVFLGENMPLILRSTMLKADQTCYRYVGHTFVQGIMDGEVARTYGNEAVWTTLV